MPAPGIYFTATRPPAPASSSRADIACFAGLVAARGSGDDLLGVPVRIESWSEFERLFDWTSRTSVPDASDRIPSALGLAVRQFFLQGGATAWVVRCDVVLNPASPIHRIAVNLALIEPPAVPTQSEAA